VSRLTVFMKSIIRGKKRLIEERHVASTLQAIQVFLGSIIIAFVLV